MLVDKLIQMVPSANVSADYSTAPRATNVRSAPLGRGYPSFNENTGYTDKRSECGRVERTGIP
jgi:hypothetical protein